MTQQQWRIEVDRGTCIGSGMCTGIAPDHFTLVDGRSAPISQTPDDAVLDAAESCPVEAILVRAAESGAILAPQQ
ncbi:MULTISPECIES: ferredoxin [Nocardia]|uniref:Ferredoxin n=1 Tax=Nocardia arthritidis TaxID=228602 RepID=A0A6G9Y6N4_9NOCA|nr:MULTISPECIES: ferredoxin [Nocardia]QIS08713.1 ferredoxin [Nocardia arthritidis]